jgi:hypothetical protein
MSFQVAYVGNHGVNLLREEGINYFDPTLGARPNPNFGNITLRTDSGFTSYNALQLSFMRRAGKAGLSFQANYTFGHAIDDVQDPQNLNNIKAERGNSSGDVR